MKEKYCLRILALAMLCVSVSTALYLINDYFMDNGWPSSFGQSCDKSVEDDCLYLHSHLNSLGIINYDDNIDCRTELNAGTQNGALYKFQFKRFDIEYAPNCTADYIEFYGSPMATANASSLIGRYCGEHSPFFDVTTQYVTVKFHTDGGGGKKGYKIRATRTLPFPCLDDFFHCKAENRCIDARLQCDGTKQCDDGTDEDDCSFFDKLLGTFLALGVSGLVGVVFACVLGCTLIGVIICIFTCCRKQCSCITRHCCKACQPKMDPGKNKVAPGQGQKTGMIATSNTTGKSTSERKTSVWTNPSDPKKNPSDPKTNVTDPKRSPVDPKTNPSDPKPSSSDPKSNPPAQVKEPVQVKPSSEKTPTPVAKDPNTTSVTIGGNPTPNKEAKSKIRVW